MTTEGQRFSVIPSTRGGVHAVYDQTIRRAFCDLSYRTLGLRAVCGHLVLPANQLTAAEPCPGCVAGLTDADEPRPAPGNPLLVEMARIHAALSR